MDKNARKPWIAAVLSLVQPGLGQVYNGELRKALLFYLLPLLLTPGLALCLRDDFLRPVLVGYLILSFAYYLFALIDAVRTARAFKDGFLPKRYNATLAYLGIYLLVVTLNLSVAGAVKSNIVQAFRHPSGSMEPTLLIGDHFLIDRGQTARAPNRGDIVVFEYPKDRSKNFVKRVVAVGGDTVEIKNKELLVNGTPVSEPYVVHQEKDLIPAEENPRDNYGPQQVPAGSYFVMGDNRDRSYDSRFWGPVPKNLLLGTAKTIYWSWDKQSAAVRWKRIGMKVL